MSDKFIVLDTYPTVYVDKARKVVKGFTVQFEMLVYNEIHEVDVPNLKVETVSKVIETLINERETLASL